MWIVYLLIVMAISKRLMEIPHIWSKSTTYTLRFKFMEKKWWSDSRPRDSWFKDLTGFNVINDAFHLFSNLPRIVLSIIVWYYSGYIAGIAMFLVYWVVDTLISNLIVKKNG